MFWTDSFILLTRPSIVSIDSLKAVTSIAPFCDDWFRFVNWFLASINLADKLLAFVANVSIVPPTEMILSILVLAISIAPLTLEILVFSPSISTFAPETFLTTALISSDVFLDTFGSIVLVFISSIFLDISSKSLTAPDTIVEPVDTEPPSVGWSLCAPSSIPASPFLSVPTLPSASPILELSSLVLLKISSKNTSSPPIEKLCLKSPFESVVSVIFTSNKSNWVFNSSNQGDEFPLAKASSRFSLSSPTTTNSSSSMANWVVTVSRYLSLASLSCELFTYSWYTSCNFPNVNVPLSAKSVTLEIVFPESSLGGCASNSKNSPVSVAPKLSFIPYLSNCSLRLSIYWLDEPSANWILPFTNVKLPSRVSKWSFIRFKNADILSSGFSCNFLNIASISLTISSVMSLIAPISFRKLFTNPSPPSAPACNILLTKSIASCDVSSGKMAKPFSSNFKFSIVSQ